MYKSRSFISILLLLHIIIQIRYSFIRFINKNNKLNNYIKSLRSTYCYSILFTTASLISADPMDISTLLQSAIQFHKAGDTHNALINYESFISIVFKENNPTTIVSSNSLVSILGNAGSLYMNIGDYENAKITFERAITIAPDSSQAYYNLAVLLTSKFNEHKRALTYAIKAMKYDSSNYKILHLIGNIFQSMGRLEDADKYFILADNLARENSSQELTTNRTIESIISSTKLPINTITSVIINGNTFSMKCISTKPLIFHLPEFLSIDECLTIQQLANNSNLEKSFVMGGSDVNGYDNVNSNYISSDKSCLNNTSVYRSSFNTWLPINDQLSYLHDRIAALTGIPLSYIKRKSEELQVVKYENGGEFKVHHDSSAYHSRLITVLIYLKSTNDREDSTANGGTWFPYAGSNDNFTLENVESAITESLDMYHNSKALSDLPGLIIKPQVGSAVLFYNYQPNSENNLDISAVHAGLPVSNEEKWVANVWIELDLNSLINSFE